MNIFRLRAAEYILPLQISFVSEYFKILKIQKNVITLTSNNIPSSLWFQITVFYPSPSLEALVSIFGFCLKQK